MLRQVDNSAVIELSSQVIGDDLPASLAEDDLSDLGVSEPVYGEKVLGTLEPDEKLMFRAVVTLTDRMQAIDSKIHGDMLISLGESVSSRADGDTVRNRLSEDVNGNSAILSEFFESERKLELIKAQLYYSLCSRFGHWDYVMGIRSKSRVVYSDRKW